jgi:hypothetical protein
MRYLLQDLAYWMMRNDYMALAPKQMVIKRLDGRLSQLIGIESITGNDILKYFVDRTGILRELAVDQIDFAHRTFQEFLCAEAIALEGDIRAVSTYLTQTEWHEVIVLASGLVSQQELAWLLSKMLSTSITSIFRDGTAKTRLNWLALECLSTEPILNEEAQKAIDKHLAKVRPPRSLREAQIMSKAKELALPYLGYSEEYTDTTTLYIIETLTLIGGNEALAKLVQFMPSLQARFTRGTPKKKPGGGPVISVHFGITGKLLLEPFGVIPSTKWGSPQSVSAIRADVPHFVRNSSIAQIELRLYKAWALWDMSEVFARQILQPLVDKTKYLFLEHAQWLNLAFEYLDLSGVEHIEFEGYDNTQNWDDIVNRLWDLSFSHN